MTAALTGAQLLVRALEREGVDLLFGYPGGAVMPIYDALVGSSLRHILVRHEQAAAFSADAYARRSGRAGVCLATSGPGATNLVTGIANAMLDSVPVVCITGNVAQRLLGTDAFQEVDILGITLPMVKHSMLVRGAGDIPQAVADAFRIATQGRPGPVLIDIPKDVQVAPAAWAQVRRPPKASVPLDVDALDRVARALATAERPLAYLGGGVKLARATRSLRAFLEAADLLSVSTLNGLGTVQSGDNRYLGMLGMHGLRAANEAVQSADLLIAIGARFDDRATGELSTFAPRARVVHLDVDPAEIGKLRPADISVMGDLATTLAELAKRCRRDERHGVWRARCRSRAEATAFRYDPPGEGVYAPALLKELSESAGNLFVAACDVGQHQMWAAQHCRLAHPEAHITSGGLGAMGYGLPAGIGAKLADPKATVVTIAGDGGFMMNIQELATLKRYGIPLKIVLIDNASLGLVRQWQELFFDGNFSEIDLSDNPDFVKVAEAFGVEAFRIDRRDQVTAGIARLLAAPGPCLAHVIIDPRESVWPLVPPGKSNADMLEGSTI